MLTQEVVNMGQTRRAFTREFKQEAVKLATAGGHRTAQVARDLGGHAESVTALEARSRR
jgi:transposase-like protein